MLRPRAHRIYCNLAHEPDTHLQLWLATAERAAADPAAPAAVRAAALEQVAVCRELLAQRHAALAALAEAMISVVRPGEAGQPPGSESDAGAA